MTQADLVLHGARLLTLAPLREERPRVGPAAGDVGPVPDGWVAARDGAIVATGHGATHERLERVAGAIERDAKRPRKFCLKGRGAIHTIAATGDEHKLVCAHCRQHCQA